MAMELVETTNGNASDKDTLYMLGGVALIVFGAGLILSNPFVRRYLSQLGIGNLATAAIPDIEQIHGKLPRDVRPTGFVATRSAAQQAQGIGVVMQAGRAL